MGVFSCAATKSDRRKYVYRPEMSIGKDDCVESVEQLGWCLNLCKDGLVGIGWKGQLRFFHPNTTVSVARN